MLRNFCAGSCWKLIKVCGNFADCQEISSKYRRTFYENPGIFQLCMLNSFNFRCMFIYFSNTHFWIFSFNFHRAAATSCSISSPAGGVVDREPPDQPGLQDCVRAACVFQTWRFRRFVPAEDFLEELVTEYGRKPAAKLQKRYHEWSPSVRHWRQADAQYVLKKPKNILKILVSDSTCTYF